MKLMEEQQKQELERLKSLDPCDKSENLIQSDSI
jgi:hypothetical protein